MCQVEIDGSPMPEDLVPLLISAYVEDSQRLPDTFALRFRDPERIVLSKSNAKVGGKLTVKVNTAASSSPTTLIEAEITALELEFDSGGTFTVIRGYDPAHRLFRDRRTVSYVQMTASDIATQVAKRAGLKVGKVDSTSTVFPFVSQAGQTDWEILTQLARDAGLDLTVRNGSFSFTAPADAGGTPAVLKFGEELVRFRSILTSAQQVGQVEVRGWNVAEKTALVGTAPAKTSTVELPTVKPTDMASAFGNPTYVSTDVPYRTQNEVDRAAKALADEKASAFAEFEGMARGNPELRAGRKVSLEGLGAPFEGKYTITSAKHRFDPTTGYTTSITVTGKQDRSLLGLASGAVPFPADPGRGGDRPGQRRTRSGQDGPGQDQLSMALGGLRQRLGPRRVPGRRARTGAGSCCPRSATRCWWASSSRTSTDRSYSAVCTTASIPCRPARTTWWTADPGPSTVVRWCPGRATGSTCWTRTAAKKASGSPPRTRSS